MSKKKRDRRAAPRLRLFLILTGLLWAAALRGSGSIGPGPLRAYLPGDGSVAGWVRTGGPQEFEGDDLYAYIDGGAEIYQEYGFRRVIVQDYGNATGGSVSLEIFEMGTPAAAFGMFTFKRSGKGRSVGLGRGAELESYYLNFWKDRFLVTVTGFDEKRGTIEGITSLGGIVAAKLPDGGEVPALLKALPEKGLRPAGVRYIKGLLGLVNVYPFPTARGLAFKEGAKGDYDDGATLILLDYGSAEARGSAWRELAAGLEAGGVFTPMAGTGTDDRLFRDGKGRYIAFAESGTRLLVGFGDGSAEALGIVGRAR